MEIRLLGAHSLETADTRLVSILVDGVLALDAGGLTSSLSLPEQQRLRCLLLTHGHYDHIKDVAAIAVSKAYLGGSLKVYATAHTIDLMATHILNGKVFPKFTELPSVETPAIIYCPLRTYRPEPVDSYTVLALPVKHTTGSVAYQVVSREGKSLFYSGDAGPGFSTSWKHISPQVLILDMTLPNSQESLAVQTGHLCPRLLRKELDGFAGMKGYLPQVVLVHINPQFEAQIKEEIQQVSREMKVDISLGYKGLTIHL